MNQDPNSKETTEELPSPETNAKSDVTANSRLDHSDSTQNRHSVAQSAPTSAENQKQEQTEPTNMQKKPVSSIVKLIAIVLLICVLGLIAFGLWKSYQPKEVELQGRVEAETIHIATKVPSRIEEIYVHEGQKVHKNQELVRLYSPEVDAKKQQALASLQSALALQSTTDRGSQDENIASLYANWQSLKAQQELAQTTYTRGAHLFQEGVISRQRRDEMQAAARSSAQMTEAAYQQYARAQRGSTPQQKSTADAQVDIANAAVAEANALEAETKLLSPVNGTISKTYAKPSELVAIGVPVASIILDDDISISLNVREDQYRSVYQAQTMQGYVPALDKTANFKVKNIDAEGEFATIKTTRQTGGYDIRSFKVHLVPEQAMPELKVGMSVLFKVKEAP